MRFPVSTALGLWALCTAVPVSAEAPADLSRRDRLYDVTEFGDALFVVGHPGHLLRSKDGGETFQALQGGQGEQALFSIAFNSKGQGAIVGRSGIVLLSDDGGESWTSTQVTLDDEHPSLFAVEVLEDGTLVAVGEFGFIVRSEDGGKTFTRVKYTVEEAEEESAGRRGDKAAPASEKRPECPDLDNVADENMDMIGEARLADLLFLDGQRGLIVGEFGLMLKTTDGGRSFSRRNGCSDRFLYNLGRAEGDAVWAVGYGGTAVRSTDGGESWYPQETGTEEDLYTVSVAGDRVLLAGAAGTVMLGSAKEPFKRIPSGVHTWLVSSWLGEDAEGILVGGRSLMLRVENGGRAVERMAIGD